MLGGEFQAHEPSLLPQNPLTRAGSAEHGLGGEGGGLSPCYNMSTGKVLVVILPSVKPDEALCLIQRELDK